jgi:hypothetical protein
MARASCLSTFEKERTMIALYDHIQELRAELRGCHYTKQERAVVEAELAKALAEQAEIERNFNRAIEACYDAEAVRS